MNQRFLLWKAISFNFLNIYIHFQKLTIKIFGKTAVYLIKSITSISQIFNH